MAVQALFIAFCLFLVGRILNNLIRRRSRVPSDLKPLPGPIGLPFIGSVHQVPDKCSWLRFAQWGEEYGPIYQVNLAGSNHVWISSDEVAHRLLSKKGAIYSDRPHIPALIDDNRTSAQYLPLLSKNDAWSRQRKFAKHIMDKSEKNSFYQYPELESIRLLAELMENPSKYNHAMESFIARVTCRLAWGTSNPSDELKQRARELLIGVSPTGALGNKLGFLMSLPDWLVPPKAWERRRAKTERRFFEVMKEEVEERIKEGPSSESWMGTFLKSRTAWRFQSDLEGAYAVGMHGIAGALTIAAPMQSFCLAMCYYPQYQARLQEEIDSVCGNRMPTSADMPRMPVLRAFIRETMRWRPPVPTGIPHALTQDDVYDGYFIPAGSVLHPLEWSISRDPTQFPEPERFNPLRWLDPSYPTYAEPLTHHPTITGYSQFGYGRRICQGQGVADADLFVGIGSIVWLFHIGKDHLEVPTLHQIVQKASQLTASDNEELSTRFRVASSNLIQSLDRPRLTCAKTSTEKEEKDFGLTVNVAEKHGASSNIDLVDQIGSPPPPPSPASSDTCPVVALSLDPESDPTLQFSSLLIAKPTPFEFSLKIRNKERADFVMAEYATKKGNGEFEDARVFQKQGGELGWGKV